MQRIITGQRAVNKQLLNAEPFTGHLYQSHLGSRSIKEEGQKEHKCVDGEERYEILSFGHGMAVHS